MELEERKEKENVIFKINNSTYIEELNESNLSLRGKKITKLLKTKRRNIIEQTKSSINIIEKAQQFQIYKFSTTYNKIITYLKSSDDNKVRYILNQLNIYFKYNEPDLKEQQMIIEGQFFELLLYLGINFLNNKNQDNLIQIIWIFINIQIYNEGNGKYLMSLYDDKFLEFYDECFNQYNSDEIMNEIIYLLYYTIKINSEIKYKIIQSKVFESIIKIALNERQDLDLTENIIKLIVVCLNIQKNYKLNEKEINMINKCYTILKIEITNNNDQIQKLSYEGLYNLSKINDEYHFNHKMIKEGIPEIITKVIKRNILEYSLKVLVNILTLSENLENINLNNVIQYFDVIINLYNEDNSLVYIILKGIFNIVDSKYINLVKSCIIWNKEMIQKIFNKNENIQLLFIKIIKYIINICGYKSIIFIYNTKVLEYLIYLISNSNQEQKLVIKVLKLIDNYLSRFNNNKKEEFEYLVIYNKFKDCINLFSDIINEDNEFLEYIKYNYK